MAWTLLIAAGMVEIAMAVALKYADGWTSLWPSAGAIAAALGSIVLLAHAVKSLPIATAYAVWTGIGAIGVSLVGIAFLGESAHLAIAMHRGGVRRNRRPAPDRGVIRPAQDVAVHFHSCVIDGCLPRAPRQKDGSCSVWHCSVVARLRSGRCVGTMTITQATSMHSRGVVQC